MRDGRRIFLADKIKDEIKRRDDKQSPDAGNTENDFCEFHGLDSNASLSRRKNEYLWNNSTVILRRLVLFGAIYYVFAKIFFSRALAVRDVRRNFRLGTFRANAGRCASIRGFVSEGTKRRAARRP